MTSPEPQTDLGEDIPQPFYQPPHQSRRWLWISLAALLLMGGGIGIGWRLFTSGSSAPATASAVPPGVKVKVSAVQTGSIEESQEFIASLVSRHSVELKPRIQGLVTQIFVKSGDSVSTGTGVLQIDASQQLAAVNSINAAGRGARDQLNNGRATLKSLEAEKLSNLADLRLNQQDYQRYANLAAQGAVSRQTRDQYISKLATSRANLEATNARIEAQRATISQLEKSLVQADANTQQQQIQLQYYKITAPFGGTVGDIPVKVGDFVNTSTSLVTITQNQPLEVNISVPLERGPQLRKGLPVEVLDAQGNILANTEVFFISPILNKDNTQLIQLKALYNNAENNLRAGQLVKARVIWNRRSGVLIPTEAVSRIAGVTFAFVPQTEKSPQGISQLVARQKPIKLGGIKGNSYQVLEGLQPDEKVIVSGILNLRDGLPIIPE